MTNDDIYSYDVNNNFYGITDGYNSELYVEIGKFIVDNIDNDIDVSKDYEYITIHSSYGKYIFVTNNVDELNKIMEKYVDDTEDADTVDYDMVM